MTFVFELTDTDDFFYVNAPDVVAAWQIFRAHFADSDESKVHIYVRIV